MVTEYLEINAVGRAGYGFINPIQREVQGMLVRHATAKEVVFCDLPGNNPGIDAPHGRSIFLIAADRCHALPPVFWHERQEDEHHK